MEFADFVIDDVADDAIEWIWVNCERRRCSMTFSRSCFGHIGQNSTTEKSTCLTLGYLITISDW